MNSKIIGKLVIVLLAIITTVFFIGLSVYDGEKFANPWVGPFMTFSYIVLAATILIVLVFLFRNLAVHPENTKKILISIGLLLVVLIVSYIISDDTIIKDIDGNAICTASESKWTSTGLTMFVILLTITIGTVVWSMFSKLTNK